MDNIKIRGEENLFQAGDKDHSRETLSTCSCRLSPLATVEDTCNAEEIESSHLQYIYISLITITVSTGPIFKGWMEDSLYHKTSGEQGQIPFRWMDKEETLRRGFERGIPLLEVYQAGDFVFL